MPVRTACADLGAPPEWESINVVFGTTPDAPSDCPAQYAVCLDAPNAAHLARQLTAVFSWQAEAWKRCGGRK